MKNKKVLIIVIAATVIAILLLGCILIIKPAKKQETTKNENTSKTEEKTEEKKEEKKEHEKIIENYAKACSSDKEKEKFIKESVNLKALYALQNVINNIDYSQLEEMSEEDLLTKINEEFETEYKNVKKTDYENDEFVEEVVNTLYDSDYENIKISNIGKLKKSDDANIKGAKECEFDVIIDGKKCPGVASFYDNKLVNIYFYTYLAEDIEDTDDDGDDLSDISSALSSQEVQLFNATFTKYEGNSKKGSEVKLLIEEIILNNDNEDRFVKLTVNVDSIDNSDLNSANDKKDVSAFSKAAKEVKNKISSGKNYKVTTSTNSEGIVDEIKIEN